MRTSIRSALSACIAVAACIGLSCSNSTSSNTPGPRTYKIGMVHWAAFSPLNVASTLGLWQSQGITVQVVNFSANADLNAALDAKTIDIALDMIGSWADLRMTGTPLTVLGETDWSNGGDKIVMKSTISINSLKGQNFGTYLNLLSVQYFIQQYLSMTGHTLNDFTLVQEPDPGVLAGKFISGEYKIIADYDPQAARAVTNGGGRVLATSADYPGCIPEGFAARSDVLAGIPQADLVKIFKGWFNAVQWASDSTNWSRYRTILNDQTYIGEGGYTDDQLKGFLANVKIHAGAGAIAANQTGGGLSQYLTQLAAFAQQINHAGTPFTAATLLDNTAMMLALQ